MGYIVWCDTLQHDLHSYRCCSTICPNKYSHLDRAYTVLEHQEDHGRLRAAASIPHHYQSILLCTKCFNFIMSAPSPIRRKTDLYRFETHPSVTTTSAKTLNNPEFRMSKLPQVDDKPLPISHEHVLDAAARLHPMFQSTGRCTELDLGSMIIGPSSNSRRTPSGEVLRNEEIVSTLNEVRKYEKARQVAHMVKSIGDGLHIQDKDGADPRLLLTRPLYVAPPKERYKKQGLGQWDRRKSRKEYVLSQTSTPLKGRAKLPEYDMATPLRPPRFCHCREPEDPSKELIRCANDRCSIGWFHLECTGLRRLPTVHEQFKCRYCSDSLEDLPECRTVRDNHGQKNSRQTDKISSLQAPPDSEGVRTQHEHAVNHDKKASKPEALSCDRSRSDVAVDGFTHEKMHAISSRRSRPSLTYQSTNGDESPSPLRAVLSTASAPLTPVRKNRLPTAKFDLITAVTEPTHQSHVALSDCIGLSNTIFESASQSTIDEPSTPPMQPTMASKPWGTPVNIDKYWRPVCEPEESSTQKRDYEVFALDAESDADSCQRE